MFNVKNACFLLLSSLVFIYLFFNMIFSCFYVWCIISTENSLCISIHYSYTPSTTLCSFFIFIFFCLLILLKFFCWALCCWLYGKRGNNNTLLFMLAFILFLFFISKFSFFYTYFCAYCIKHRATYCVSWNKLIFIALCHETHTLTLSLITTLHSFSSSFYNNLFLILPTFCPSLLLFFKIKNCKKL